MVTFAATLQKATKVDCYGQPPKKHKNRKHATANKQHKLIDPLLPIVCSGGLKGAVWRDRIGACLIHQTGESR